MRKPSEAPEVSPAWVAFFRVILEQARRLAELEAQQCNAGSRQ